MSDLQVLDVFCGAGGLSTGFESAGFTVIAGIDWNEDYLATFDRNHTDSQAIQSNLFEESPTDVLEEYDIDADEVDVIVGGPPCKGFSVAGERDPNDERNTLVDSYLDFVQAVQPRVFVMENVPGILSMEDGAVVDHILARADELGYRVDYQLLNAADYGVPQARKRVFFIGRRDGGTPRFPAPTHAPPAEAETDGLKPHVTVEEAFEGIDWESVENHVKTNHQDDTVERIKEVEHGESLYDSYSDSWRRLYPDRPAPTIKENHNAPFIHPFENRVGTVRECAVLQGFPLDYVFEGAKSTQLKTVGNAVPPPLAAAIAGEVRAFLE